MMMNNKDENDKNNSTLVLSQDTAKHQMLPWQQQMAIKPPVQPDILPLPWWVECIRETVFLCIVYQGEQILESKTLKSRLRMGEELLQDGPRLMDLSESSIWHQKYEGLH